ncbi:hypothetical protein DAA51_00515 [Bradyrhizobium sp. WBAH10]|nr:hypothetical protein [Bradyrhizobium sp. WBAH30]MDD1546124.1 hypothetical protein [Bradyrhizobium sp. WBAH41]MDD1560004.1 hypothetical protein [Bradyrhizobium sp. WBAH23]MDD1567106.1 hypothetical protein [Bradyrhizobium sp. WBAH33]MDD1593414.1 hypothetical protein [Bradyrhizobium sp. WBAH42]NRB90616.1 hypothetical protein [Bradyrhizobium sp. WBAH10]QCJ87159.1 hypothetical protein DAA57_00435 [Bradyrhizobium yuanmingense]
MQGCIALAAHAVLTNSKYFRAALVKRRVPPYLRSCAGRIMFGRRYSTAATAVARCAMTHVQI